MAEPERRLPKFWAERQGQEATQRLSVLPGLPWTLLLALGLPSLMYDSLPLFDCC